jgi:hypothetical protein
MAASDNRMTLLDYAKSKDPDGQQAQVIELANQLSPVLQDAPAYPCNSPYGNRTTLRRSLPTVGTAKINRGVTRSKSTTDQRTDTLGFFSGRSEVDARIRKIEGAAAYAKKRSDENAAFQESLAQLITNYAFYGDVKSDEAGFDGLSIRMAALNAGVDVKAAQVWNQASGQAVVGGDGSSMFVVDWGERSVFLGFPPNTTAGLDVQDLGDISVNDDDGNPFQAGTTLYEWFVGLVVKDPRHMARLANIDLSDSAIDTPLQGKIFDNMERLFAMMPDPGAATRVIYCPLRLYSSFLKQARTVSNLALSMMDYLGKPTPSIWGYPLRRSDQLSITEGTIS